MSAGGESDAPVVVLATRNRGKLVEIVRLLGESIARARLVTIDELAPAARLDEDGDTFEANALAKARQAAAATGLPAIADDSGLEVDALDGAPGVYSARYAGEPSDDARNNQKLLDALRGVPAAKRTRALSLCRRLRRSRARDRARAQRRVRRRNSRRLRAVRSVSDTTRCFSCRASARRWPSCRLTRRISCLTAPPPSARSRSCCPILALATRAGAHDDAARTRVVHSLWPACGQKQSQRVARCAAVSNRIAASRCRLSSFTADLVFIYDGFILRRAGPNANLPTVRLLLQDVASGIRVLQSRDGVALSDEQILERARNIVAGLVGNYRIVSLDPTAPRSRARTAEQLDLLAAIERVDLPVETHEA